MAAPMIPPAHARDFLAASGWIDAEILPLAGDASFRRYFRVVGPGRSAVLMDAPPPHEDPQPFVAVAQWLLSRGLSAPEILASDLNRGLLLLSDFGDARLRVHRPFRLPGRARRVDHVGKLLGSRRRHIDDCLG